MTGEGSVGDTVNKWHQEASFKIPKGIKHNNDNEDEDDKYDFENLHKMREWE